MSKRLPKPATKRHVVIFDEDWEWLDARFGLSSSFAGGISAAVRTIVHAHVKRLRQAEATIADQGGRAAQPVEANEELIDG